MAERHRQDAVDGIECSIYIQCGEQVFDTLPILQVFQLTKHVEVCNFLS